MANSKRAQYRRARRELDRHIAKAIDEALTSAYLETSQDVYGLLPQLRMDTFDRLFLDSLEGYLAMSRTVSRRFAAQAGRRS